MAQDDVIHLKVDRRLEHLLPRFLANCRRDAKEIRRAAAAGELPAARAIGHSLRGSGGFYGLHEVSVIGAGIERAARDGNAPAVAQLVERLDRYLARVRPEFE